jgi:hypothetical protein
MICECLIYLFRSSNPHHEFTCITCEKTLDKIVKQFAIDLPKQLIERGQKCSERYCRVLQPLLFFKIILWVVHCTLIYQKNCFRLAVYFLSCNGIGFLFPCRGTNWFSDLTFFLWNWITKYLSMDLFDQDDTYIQVCLKSKALVLPEKIVHIHYYKQ